MYGIPSDLDLSAIVGEFTTQIRVGQFDLQLTFGPVTFAVQSDVSIHRGERVLARWTEGTWPHPEFFNLMNSPVARCEVGPEAIVLDLENGLSVKLVDDSEKYETMQITAGDDIWII